MLQRAASNAYSWWWASHIRTKQSKWLEQCLQDVEEKTQYMLKMIEEDGDSFRSKAEMYYKKRPELINFVEESYRAFRALAERYDHLSTELQNANNTIATLFPDQCQLEMDEDYDEFAAPKRPPQFGGGHPKSSGGPGGIPGKVPKAPKAPIKAWKGLINASKNLQAANKPRPEEPPQKTATKSGLERPEALEEIDKLQKDILALQTVKEFVKSSYQSGLDKYYNLENQIVEMQQRVCSLQDEFSVDKVIDDDEARTLMAEAALKSCQETLARLQEQQEKSNEEAKKEYTKIEDARQKLKAIREEFLKEKSALQDKLDRKPQTKESSSTKDLVAQEMMKENAEMMGSFTVSKLADKIDELVNKVISLESSVSSQTVLIDRLRTESDELHVQVKVLETDKANLIGDTKNLNARVTKLEEKFVGVQDLNHNVEKQNDSLQSNFAEAKTSLNHLSEKLNSVKPDEEIEVLDSPAASKQETLKEQVKENAALESPALKQEVSKEKETEKTPESTPLKQEDPKGKQEEKAPESTTLKQEDPKEKQESKQEEKAVESSTTSKHEDKALESSTLKQEDPKDIKGEKSLETISDEKEGSGKADKKKVNDEEQNAASPKEGGSGEGKESKEFNWQQMLLSGVEDKEKVLLKEYTTILRNYKDTKKKLGDMQKQDKDQQFELALQIRELKACVAKRDEEIERLRKRLCDRRPGSSGGENLDLKQDDRSQNPGTEEEDEEIRMIMMDQPKALSQVEEKLRAEIDAILEENLDFWLRFSTSFHQVQKFKNTVQDLQQEISRLKEKKKQEDSTSTGDLKSDARATYKHLKEIQRELTVWNEQGKVLKDELERRFTSLCNIQERITVALKEGVEEEEIRFSSHQAAKFQGEVLNMKQENNKVRDELRAGVDHVKRLQGDIEKALFVLDQEFELSGIQPQLRQSASRKIPLRSFIFGTKLKKQKNSLFPFNRKYQALRAGLM